VDIPVIVGQVLFLSVTVLAGLLLHRLLRLETTLACLLAGVLAGLSLPWLQLDTGIRASNIQDPCST
jgi:CPA1 family monovalent cation:H+ antiporter